MSQTGCLLGLKIALPAFRIICTIIIIYCTIQYVKSKRTVKNKPLYFMGLSILVAQLIAYLIFIVMDFLFDCNSSRQEPAVYTLIRLVGNMFMIFQYWMLFLMLFYRLKCAFDGTTFQLSKCTIFSFGTLYFVWTAETLIAFADVAEPLYALSFLLSIVVIFVLGFLFIYKLIVVHRRSGAAASKGSALISFITKVALLTLFSIASLMILVILLVIFLATDDDAIHPVVSLFLLGMSVNIDMFTNFVSVILTYSRFERVYNKVCGCCDNGCKVLCKRLVNVKEDGPAVNPDILRIASHSPSVMTNSTDSTKYAETQTVDI